MANEERIKEQIEYYRRRAAEYDEWHLRQGRYDRGEDHRRRWFAELDAIRTALTDSEPSGRILEIAAGTGLWTEQLARSCDSLIALDASVECLEINRGKTRDPRVEYVVSDAFDRCLRGTYDFVFFGFWLSHVPEAIFKEFWATVERVLVPNGKVFFTDSLLTQESTAKGHTGLDRSGTAERMLNDGSQYTIVKVFYEPEELEEKLAETGWRADVRATGEFFLYGIARRGEEG